ncbi:MAG: polyhydroxyalkanoate synthesis repressor PhaR [Rubrivivax sp.]|nr:polyhydroxyalkanoate synthesis repressor PhaR [Rubrivivax sp.]
MPTRRRAAAAAPATPAADSETAGAVRVLKKYPNRRLYDTRNSSYITLADVKQMVLGGEDFEVLDAKTGEDLTRSILLQIILEEESGGVPMFSAQTLSQIIRFYGHAMQGVMGTMIEKNMQAFVELQKQFLNQSTGLYDPKHLSPEVWTQFLSGQAPTLQNLMTGYVEQSREMFEKLQRAGTMFPGMPGFPPSKK